MPNRPMMNDIKLLRLGAMLQIIAIVLLGPLFVKIIAAISPQPPWAGMETYIAHYSLLQSIPYWGGFILIIGNILFVVSSGRLSNIKETALYPLALITVTIYSSLVALNYTLQVAYIPAAVQSSSLGIELFSMDNPNSIAWSIEMYAYAILGIAMWLVSPSFRGNRVKDLIRYLLVFDAIISISGAFFAIVFIGGMLDEGSLVGYYFWNLLILVIAFLILYEYRSEKNTY